MKIKNKIILFLLLCSALLISACGADKAEVKHEVTVLAAASLTDVMEELKTKYEEKEEDTGLTLSFGSSGALMAQIEEGAPADVFFSADTKQMDELNEKGFITEGSIVPLLENRLVLVVPENSTKNITSFEDAVSKADVIGLGEPESVPAGRYAEEVFDYLGILDKVRTKANYGSDVRTVLTWVEEGGADCGVVYKTDAYSSDKVRIVAEAPEGSLRKVIYPVGIVNTGNDAEGAGKLVDFLTSEEAMEIFKAYGFEEAE